MSRKTLGLSLVLAAFGAYSGYALLEFGYIGIWRAAFLNLGTGQVLFDLCVALLLVTSWMLKDARETGRKAWPYILMTLSLGSFGPLFYLLVGAFGESRTTRG